MERKGTSAELAQSGEAHLRLSLIPLFLEHPKYASHVCAVAKKYQIKNAYLPDHFSKVLDLVLVDDPEENLRALALLGSPRLTIDIDFIGDDVHPNQLYRTIMQIAREMQIHVELVPLERFVPLLERNEERDIRIGQLGVLEVIIADPYSIALS